MASRKEIAIVLSDYLEMYPEYKLSPKGLGMYADTLQRYPIEQIKVAMRKLAEKSEYFPKPAHIISAIEELAVHVTTDGRGIPDAGEAFEEMLAQASQHGQFLDKWKFSTPEIELAVKRFGKNECLYMQESDIGIARAQFRKIYEAELRRISERKLNNAALSGAMGSLVDKLATHSSRVFLIE